MKHYTGEEKIYVPRDYKVHGVTMDHNYYVSHEGFGGLDMTKEVVPESNVIILSPDELLDLMQESIEHSYPTLLREKAIALLISKGIQI